MDETIRERIIHVTGILLFLLFTLWSVAALGSDTPELSFDRFFSALGIIGLTYFHKRLNLNLPLYFLALTPIILHNAALYGNVYFGFPFDRMIHFFSGFVIAIVAVRFLSKILKKEESTVLVIVLLSFFIAGGIASLNEPIEFVGYHYLGEGEGLLMYGDGDWGEWNNASWDLISNYLGALLGALTGVLLTRKDKHI